MQIDNEAYSTKFKIPERGKFKIEDINIDHPLIWSAFCRGDCVGTFQLETELGRYWSARIKPNSLEELSDLVSLIRPGPLNSGSTELYAKRKAGELPVEYIHSSLEPILSRTQGIICYQEQCSKIAMDIGGFSEAEAETLRKGISKKIPEIVNKCKSDFIEKSIQKGIVNKETAEKIFESIETFQRYGFCYIHGLEYGLNSIYSQAIKVFFPLEFYCVWMSHSINKGDPKEELYKLVQDARIHNIKILPPDIRKKNIDFQIAGEKQILFGLNSIKGFGSSSIKALQKDIPLDTFADFIRAFRILHRGVCENLIKCGSCDCYSLSRTLMLKNLYVILGRSDKDEEIAPEVKKLTPNEYNEVMDKINEGLIVGLQSVIDKEICVAKRIPTIQAKIEYLQKPSQDTNTQKSIYENLYLGVNLTCSSVDDYIKESGCLTCKEIYKLKDKEKATVYAVIDEIIEKESGEKSKNPGQKFGILKISDSTLSLGGIMVWSDQWAQLRETINENDVIKCAIRKNNYNGRDGYNLLFLDKIE